MNCYYVFQQLQCGLAIIVSILSAIGQYLSQLFAISAFKGTTFSILDEGAFCGFHDRFCEAGKAVCSEPVDLPK